MFKPKVMTNQVKLTLLVGMALILATLFMGGAYAGVDYSPPGVFWESVSDPADWMIAGRPWALESFRFS